MRYTDCHQNTGPSLIHDQNDLRLGLCALRHMAGAGTLELSLIADGCEMDIGLARQVIGVFEELGYARQVHSGAHYALTPAGRTLAASLVRDTPAGGIH